MALGKFDEARQQYERAVLITRNAANALPDSLPARNGLFLAVHDYRRGVQSCKKMIEEIKTEWPTEEP